MSRYLLSFLLSVALLLPACLRQSETAGAPVLRMTAGNLRLDPRKDVPRSIYIDIRDATGHVPLSTAELARVLGKDNFRLVQSPSEAGYILHVTLLQEGPVDPATLRRLVDTGYGSDAQFSGTGQSGWLADALLVQRRVPSDKRPSQIRLKNISSRNAIDNAQMRIAIHMAKELHGRNAYQTAFAGQLAQAISDAMRKQD